MLTILLYLIVSEIDDLQMQKIVNSWSNKRLRIAVFSAYDGQGLFQISTEIEWFMFILIKFWVFQIQILYNMNFFRNSNRINSFHLIRHHRIHKKFTSPHWLIRIWYGF